MEELFTMNKVDFLKALMESVEIQKNSLNRFEKSELSDAPEVFQELDQKIKEIVSDDLRASILENEELNDEEKIKTLKKLEENEIPEELYKNFMESCLKPIFETVDVYHLETDEPKIVDGPVFETALALEMAALDEYKEIAKLVKFTESTRGVSPKFSKPLSGKVSKKELLSRHISNIMEDWKIDNPREAQRIIKEAKETIQLYEHTDLMIDPLNVVELFQESNLGTEELAAEKKRLTDQLEKLYKMSGSYEYANNPKARESLDKSIADITNKLAALKEPVGPPLSPEKKPGFMDSIRSKVSNFSKDVSEKGLGSAVKERIKSRLPGLVAAAQRARQGVVNLVSRFTGGDVAAAQRYVPSLTTTGKFALGATAIAAISALAYKFFKRKDCSKLEGEARKACEARVIDKTIATLNAQKSKCSVATNPEKCRAEIDKMIKNWNARKR